MKVRLAPNGLDEIQGEVKWRGWLYEEEFGKEVGIGWCTKGNHYLLWSNRVGHVEECMWRKGRLYGK